MKSRRLYESTLAVLLLLAACLTTAVAQDADSGSSNPPSPSGQTSTDPPGRVARVQYISGEVSVQPGGIDDWVAASLNRPLTTSDRVWTDKSSKAELSVGGGYIRLNSEASLTLTNVSDQTVQLELDQGTLELTVRYLGPGQIYEVDTANLAFTVMKPGVYRFDVFPQEDATWVTVRKGYGETTGLGTAVKIKSGEQVRFGNGSSLQHTAEAAPAPDGFDDWASVRDKRLDSSASARYVSPGVIGYEDLDGYGSWRTIAPYGPVWVPSAVPVGWAPYRFGHWVWIAPWGWTWVDDAAWGFAPFHYGRWVYTGGYWGWAPGPYRYWAPCYAPALVAWVGGPGFGVGFGFGGGWGAGVNFGWFPLGWGEPYYPWYRGWYGRGLSPTYVRKVNVTNTYVTNVTNITNNYYNNNITNIHYANRKVNGAVTAAPASAIASGQAMNHAGQVVPSSGLMHAPATRNVNVTPTRTAMLGGQARTDRALPPDSAANRSVVTHAAPPPSMLARANTPAAAPAPVTSASATSTSKVGTAGGSNPSLAIHRPPAARNGNTDVAGRPAPTTSAALTTHNVPRPPATTQSKSATPQAGSATPATTNSNAMHPATQAHSVPRPPSSSEVQHSTATAVPHEPTQEHGATASHSGAPEHKASPQHSAPAEGKNSSRDRASAVPRPSAGYTYHTAAAYSPAEYGRSSFASGAGYGSGHSYVPSAHRYADSPSHGDATHGQAAYSGHYAAPSGGFGGGHYSAPPSGGGAGGSSHAMHASAGRNH